MSYLEDWTPKHGKCITLWCTIAYNAGYSRSISFPSRLTSQKHISDPSLIKNDPYLKKCFFIAMSLTQKCESPGFQKTYDNAFEPTYFCLRNFCQIPFLTSRSWMPNPPWSFGRHTTLHLASLYFFFSLSPYQRNLDQKNPVYSRHLLVEGRRITCTVPC
jgi:hypothetical protein